MIAECSEDHPCDGLGEHAHFKNFGMAFLTLFRIATGDNWNGIMKVRSLAVFLVQINKNHCLYKLHHSINLPLVAFMIVICRSAAMLNAFPQLLRATSLMNCQRVTGCSLKQHTGELFFEEVNTLPLMPLVQRSNLVFSLHNGKPSLSVIFARKNGILEGEHFAIRRVATAYYVA